MTYYLLLLYFIFVLNMATILEPVAVITEDVAGGAME